MKILTVLVCVHSNNKLHDELLIESLKSLEKQTFKNFETVIVLDECWENTEKKILSEITLDYKLYHKEKKQGLSYAKNYGLSKINTDLVCFLDADDFFKKKPFPISRENGRFIGERIDISENPVTDDYKILL